MLAFLRLRILVTYTLVGVAHVFLTNKLSVSMASRTGWSTRAILHKEEFMPTTEDMPFQLLLSTPAQSEGFICAFFRPNIVVISVEHVLSIPQEDVTGIQ
jgi:hypothetical protein